MGYRQVTRRTHPLPVVDKSDQGWHLDRKIPIAIIITIMAQTGAIVWWAASAEARLNTLEHTVQLAAPQGDRLTRVETKIEVVQDGIAEIKSILRKEPVRNRR